MIGSYSPWFIETLRERLEKEQVSRAVDLGNDFAEDFAAYRYGCGLIQGLRVAVEIMDEIKQEVDKG